MPRLVTREWLRCCASCLWMAATLQARASDEQPSRWLDPTDGQFDMSNVLLTHRGVLPVPTIITEPAVGYGLGLGLLYFTAPRQETQDSGARKAPPNITGVGAFATGTHSWGCHRHL